MGEMTALPPGGPATVSPAAKGTRAKWRWTWELYVELVIGTTLLYHVELSFREATKPYFSSYLR